MSTIREDVGERKERINRIIRIEAHINNLERENYKLKINDAKQKKYIKMLTIVTCVCGLIVSVMCFSGLFFLWRVF